MDKKALITVLAVFAVVLAVLPKMEDTGITGAAVTRTSLTIKSFKFNHTCAIELHEGWNLMSIPCVPQNTSLVKITENISYSEIHSYDANASLDKWKSYNPSLPSWVVQDLHNISQKKGYWIKMDNNDTLVIGGYIEIPTETQIRAGWNLVGFPINSSKEAGATLTTMGNKYSSVHAYNATDYDDHWKVYYRSQDPDLNDLKRIEPYWGYWVNADEPCSWWTTI